MDVDEKEQWLAPVDVDEEGSCDEIVMANDDSDSEDNVICADELEAVPKLSPAEVDPSEPAGFGAPTDTAARVADCAASTDLHSADLVDHTVDKTLDALRPCLDKCPASSPVSSADGVPARWECTSCGEVNKSSRDQCNNCGGDPPWCVVRSPVRGEDVDELSSGSSSPGTPQSGGSVAESVPKSVADVVESPAASVDESLPRSVAASGSAKSIAESASPSVADIDSGDEHACVDVDVLLREEEDELQLEAERVTGEIADARARIYHGAS